MSNKNNYINVKKEDKISDNQPIIIQNAVYLPDFSQAHSFKLEPEEKNCLEIKNHDNYLTPSKNEGKFNSSLKIVAVTQQYKGDFNDKDIVKVSKRVSSFGKLTKVVTKTIEKSTKIEAQNPNNIENPAEKRRKLNENPLIKPASDKNGTASDLQIYSKLINKITKCEPPNSDQKTVKQKHPFPFSDQMTYEMVDYEPKIAKKRKVLSLECDNCDKVFKSKYSIIWHMKEHMLTMPFNCSICGKGFSYERSFHQHELTHAEKVKCEICGKSLKPHAMYYHMKYKHTDEKTHKCPLCPKAFKTKDNISRHMMRHNMEFTCSICGRKFPENSRLQTHLSMHENPEMFFCSICNKSFEHIDRHIKRLHSKKRERNMKCRFCEYASDSKQTVRRHEEMHEKRNEILQSKTRKRKIKQKIIGMKTFECKVCNVVLQTKSGYKSHLRHYHKGKDEVKAVIVNEVKDSIKSDEYVEIKVEKQEFRAIQ